MNEKRKKGQLIGITGGMGAGKSALGNLYRELGYPVFSADKIAREIVEPGQPALAEISALFGTGSLQPDGTLDRAAIRERIAKNPSLRLQLEAITHPRIQARTLELAAAAFAGGADLVFYEAPLLFEAKSDAKMDKVICVHAEENVRLARVQKRDGGDPEVVKKLSRSQLSQEEKMRRSDYLVENNGDLPTLRARALEVLDQIQQS